MVFDVLFINRDVKIVDTLNTWCLVLEKSLGKNPQHNKSIMESCIGCG